MQAAPGLPVHPHRRRQLPILGLILAGIAGLAMLITAIYFISSRPPGGIVNQVDNPGSSPSTATPTLILDVVVLEPSNTPLLPRSTPTHTSTPTKVPTFTPTHTPNTGDWQACPDSYLSRLHIDDPAYVSLYPPLANRVRSAPGLDGRVLGYIQPGENIRILDGPGCETGWTWWYIRSDKTGLTGWTAEGDNENYWLVPTP